MSLFSRKAMIALQGQFRTLNRATYQKQLPHERKVQRLIQCVFIVFVCLWFLWMKAEKIVLQDVPCEIL